MLTNNKHINIIISFDKYFVLQVEKGKRSSVDEDTNQTIRKMY